MCRTRLNLVGEEWGPKMDSCKGLEVTWQSRGRKLQGLIDYLKGEPCITSYLLIFQTKLMDTLEVFF